MMVAGNLNRRSAFMALASAYVKSREVSRSERPAFRVALSGHLAPVLGRSSLSANDSHLAMPRALRDRARICRRTRRTSGADLSQVSCHRLGFRTAQRNKLHREALQGIRQLIRDRTRFATCLGFGPRFLHSTGQVYKGGPNTGLFLQITCDDKPDIKVPERKYTFGVVTAAEARGDFEVLAERDRRLLRVHLGDHVTAGLTIFKEVIREALS